MLAASLATVAGCWQPPKMQRAELERGYLLILEGIDFAAWQMEGTWRGLRDAGIDWATDVRDWGYRNWLGSGYMNLADLKNNRAWANSLAGEIVLYQREYPGRPVSILGYSGGGGLAVLTAEALPTEARLDRIVLLGAALSPEYDLSRALERCARGIINFYSSADAVILGAGTKLYGTIDRRNVASAGHTGFRVPPEASVARPELYANLVQVAWTPAMARLGHDGGHFGWIARRWAAEIVSPYLKPPPTTRTAGRAQARRTRS